MTETATPTKPKKPGVYVCKGCGIGEAVDADALANVAKSEFRIQTTATQDACCSDEGVAAIKADVDAGTVDGVVVAACSHRVMADRFRFNGTPVVRANLREHVAWSQPPGEEDTEMLAADQVRMAITQVQLTLPPLPSQVQEYSRTLLVLGGGITGMTAAREAVKAGHPVILVEKTDQLGGWANKWAGRMPYRPPYRDVQDSGIAKLVEAVKADKDIDVKLDTRVVKTAGQPGAFTVTLSHGGQESVVNVGAVVVATGFRPYDATKLGHLGYGASPDIVTGVELEAMLKAGGELKRKSDGKPVKHIAFVQCAGSRDPDHLPYCSSVCCGVSIKQALQITKADAKASAYIVYEELRTPGTAEEFYRQAQEAGVIFMKGKATKVDAGAMQVSYTDELLGTEVPLAGLDMIVLATGMVPNSTDPDVPVVEPEKSEAQLKGDINPFSAIPVAGYKPGGAEGPTPPAMPHLDRIPEGGPILNLQYRQGPHIPVLADGFSDSHYICFPYETRRTGIYTAGPVRRPMDMAESAEDAAGAVMKAIQAIQGSKMGVSLHPRVGDLSFPKVGHEKCTKCRRCTVECPFGAIDEDETGRPIINPARCRRCGTCMGACPVQTITFDNYNPQMVNAMIEANEIPDEFSEKPRILVLACENDAYPALDMAGINREKWSPYVRTIPVRCLGSVTLQWVSTALQKGYDGIMLMGCKSGDDYQCHFVKGSAIAKERMSKVGETLKSLALEKERVTMAEVSIADSHRVPKVLNEFAELIGGLDPNPMKGF
ncbi:MAG: hydrogenase iron-sulfur subunit [Hyphomicrobiaceae bacterium]|nr:hydrogenase iron-sulfur subunit [Hyphomicrobiaceae bacterium]